MKILPILLQLLFLCTACSKADHGVLPINTGTFRELSLLPEILQESSGLEISHTGVLWSHNDHKGAPSLYGFDSTGVLMRTLHLANAANKDWEDLAQDAAGNFYIGDFGNNDNDRKDLVIYKIPNPDEITGPQVTAEAIHFSLEDQSQFPPSENARLFDVEAMLARGDFLYLFTRDRSKPFQGKTKLYKLPNTPGTHTAILMGGFFTDAKQNNGAITSADISPDGSRVAILSNRAVWEFSNFQDDNFLSGSVQRIDLPLNAQMESIHYLDDCSAYLTNEKQNGYESRLFRLEMCQ
jgi:hypothetical protein